MLRGFLASSGPKSSTFFTSNSRVRSSTLNALDAPIDSSLMEYSSSSAATCGVGCAGAENCWFHGSSFSWLCGDAASCRGARCWHGVRRPCLNWHGGTPRIVVLRRLLRYRRWCGPRVDIIAGIGNGHMFRVLFRRFHVVDAACDYRLRLHLLHWHGPWIVIQLRWGYCGLL